MEEEQAGKEDSEEEKIEERPQLRRSLRHVKRSTRYDDCTFLTYKQGYRC